ncbi:hypothetical protein GCM10025791_29460 [Halioxenophilus aromaticivorans]|uniref:Uncharacterized protein n=1 Tax=Halioxenophilus aromaticivorans TaxID=1306992 RepID=A0AAV3U503_9ALTE
MHAFKRLLKWSLWPELQCQTYNIRATITGREHPGTVISISVALRKLVYEDQEAYECKLYGNCDAQLKDEDRIDRSLKRA